MFDALGGLPLGGIPDGVVVPVPPSGGGGSSSAGGGGYRHNEWYSERRDKPEEPTDELAILLAAYVQYYKD